MIYKLFILVTLILFIVSCNTNPPTSPDLTPTGNVVLTLKVDNTVNVTSASKVVIIEDFANVSCNPCVISNKIIEGLTEITYGRSKLVAVKFPTNFPAPNDLFYLAAKEICDARISYYNVFFAPTTVIDGILKPISTDSNSVKAAVDTRLAVTPRFNINVGAILEGDYSVTVDVKFIDTSSINMSDLVIHTVLTETDIEFEQAPGSNGETKFYDVTRLMLPSKDGTPIRQLIDQGELTFTFEDALLSSWNLEKLNFVIYIQNKTTKEIFQTGSTFE
ncbi:MAG TPA: Omp28-related outer membrane protein [Ignavibacteriaceae bacterium]|nr:Omp28-related outer membrane protein [Ignavibacteriaceae bacterium]